jgi:hypothetical protein
MAKHSLLVYLGMFVLILSLVLTLGFTSADTLVGGKIYNSDFSEVIGGATVNVDCGSDLLYTTSLSDGTFAVTFDSDSCYSAHEVQVSASKGNLSGEDTSIINNSTEDEGEYVAVANVNLNAPVSVRTGNRHGGFFLCGNTVCDSGETYATCPSDCAPVPEGNTLNPLVAPLDDSGNNNPPSTKTQTIQATSSIPGITGAVTGTGDNDGDNDNALYLILGLILLLVIGIGITSLVRGNMHRKRMGYN